MSVRLMGIIDTINMIDKYDVNYTYDTKRDEYIIPDDEYNRLLNSVKNKKYIENLKVGNGRMYGPNTPIAGPNRDVYGAEEDSSSSQVVFTPAAVLDLLTQIDELSDKNISLSETLDGKIQITIDASSYIIESNTSEIEVDDEVVEAIDDENTQAYQDIVDSGQADVIDDDDIEPIEGGMIKDFAKSLLLGGMIRFAGKHLLK